MVFLIEELNFVLKDRVRVNFQITIHFFVSLCHVASRNRVGLTVCFWLYDPFKLLPHVLAVNEVMLCLTKAISLSQRVNCQHGRNLSIHLKLRLHLLIYPALQILHFDHSNCFLLKFQETPLLLVLAISFTVTDFCVSEFQRVYCFVSKVKSNQLYLLAIHC